MRREERRAHEALRVDEASVHRSSKRARRRGRGLELAERVGRSIGVHQVAALGSATAGLPRNEMSVAQNISARCQRYLGDMGVNLQAWVHAMETPHDRLFIFKPDELKSLNIVTTAAPAAPTPVTPAPTAKTRS